MPRRLILWVATLLSVGVIAAPAAGQGAQEALINRLEQEMLDAQIEQRIAAHEGQTTFERMTLDYGASLRFGIAGIQGADGADSTLYQYEANVFANAVVDGGHRIFGNLRFLYNQYDVSRGSNETGFLVPYGNRYWYQFDLKALQRATEGAAGDLDLNMRAGRQFINWNSGLIYSNDIYGMRVRGGTDRLSWEGLIGVTASSGFYDFDPSRSNYDSQTDRALFGIRGGWTFGPELELFVSGFWQRDHNENRNVTVTLPVTGETVTFNHNFDTSYLSVGGSGAIGPEVLWTLELVRETGTRHSRHVYVPGPPLQAVNEDSPIEAYAGVFNLSWAPSGIATRPRIDGTLAFGTGDADHFTTSGGQGGNHPGTTDHSFQSMGYVYTGLAGAPSLTNLLMLRVGGSVGIPIEARRPDALRVGMDVFLFGKQKVDAPVSLRFSNNNRYLGTEVDWKIDWRLTSDVSFTLRAGLYWPGSDTPALGNLTRHFVYGGFTYGF
ncbi:MAG: hypothetical protein MK101_08175 [Phycisphaerales bacterium]|nr:hypothetical protein [Phycisphaerales bacterium]